MVLKKTQFSSTVFHSLSHRVIRLVAYVSSKNTFSLFKFMTFQWVLKLSLATKQGTQCERVWKIVPENGVFSCVAFCLRSFGRFASCLFNAKKFHTNLVV